MRIATERTFSQHKAVTKPLQHIFLTGSIVEGCDFLALMTPTIHGNAGILPHAPLLHFLDAANLLPSRGNANLACSAVKIQLRASTERVMPSSSKLTADGVALCSISVSKRAKLLTRSSTTCVENQYTRANHTTTPLQQR
jgi:hypothetical protein